MTEFTTLQMSFSTAEIETMYFTVVEGMPGIRDTEPLLPNGVYRVIAGELFRLVDGVPPWPQDEGA